MPPFSWQASIVCRGTKRAGRWARANRLMTKRTLLNPILVGGRGCTWGLELHRRPPVSLWWSIGPDLARGHWRRAGRWMAREREKEGGREGGVRKWSGGCQMWQLLGILINISPYWSAENERSQSGVQYLASCLLSASAVALPRWDRFSAALWATALISSLTFFGCFTLTSAPLLWFSEFVTFGLTSPLSLSLSLSFLLTEWRLIAAIIACCRTDSVAGWVTVSSTWRAPDQYAVRVIR